MDMRQLCFGDAFGAIASCNFASSSGLSICRRTAPASTFWPRSTGISARPSTRAAMSMARAVGFALDEQRCRHREVPGGKSEDRQDDQRDDDGRAAAALFRRR
jgi:hypothetical protein